MYGDTNTAQDLLKPFLVLLLTIILRESDDKAIWTKKAKPTHQVTSTCVYNIIKQLETNDGAFFYKDAGRGNTLQSGKRTRRPLLYSTFTCCNYERLEWEYLTI